MPSALRVALVRSSPSPAWPTRSSSAQTPEGKPWPRAVLLDDEPVGFLMMSWDVEPAPTLHGPYFLWRLLVDERRQRQGIGRAALAIVCQDVLRDAADRSSSRAASPVRVAAALLRGAGVRADR